MLIQFRFENFRSFKESAELTMLSTNLSSAEELKEVDNTNTYNIKPSNISVVRSAAIYGANASGKSNIIKAISFMRKFTLDSSRTGQNSDVIDVQPFLLDEISGSRPCGFEVIISLEGIRYRYGFEVNESEVVSEWLYYVPKNREFKLFIRSNEKIEIAEKFKKEAKDLFSITRKNALFISVVSQFNGEVSGKILNWFKKIEIVDYNHLPSYTQRLSAAIANPVIKDVMLKILRGFDTGISNLKLDESDTLGQKELSRWPVSLRDFVKNSNTLSKSGSVATLHDVFNEKGEVVSSVEFDMDIHESDGTKKLYSILPFLILSLGLGNLLIVDELDSRLHPLLTQRLLQMFHDKDLHTTAQLIFTTHDTNLLTRENFRRDQIWFVEKSRKASSCLYSLAEVQARNDANYEKDYLKGRYGGIPFINSSKVLENYNV